MSDTSARVRIRGTKDGLIITLGDGTWEAVLAELEEHLSRKPDFFRGGRVAVAVGERHLQAEPLHALGDLLHRYGMTLWAVWSTSEVTQRTAADLGLETGLGTLLPATEVGPRAAERATIVFGPIRSGQRIQDEGSLVVIGDVHPGAEVVCGGYLIVWGRLQGVAHAGAHGRTDVFIAALVFAPTQVRIGPLVAQGNPLDLPETPEIARVEGSRIVVEPWSRWRRRTWLNGLEAP